MYKVQLDLSSSYINKNIIKINFIYPILKSGSSSNYYPIIFLLHFSKLYDILVLNSVCSMLNHIISNEKHDFRLRSTIKCNLDSFSFIFGCFRQV